MVEQKARLTYEDIYQNVMDLFDGKNITLSVNGRSVMFKGKKDLQSYADFVVSNYVPTSTDSQNWQQEGFGIEIWKILQEIHNGTDIKYASQGIDLIHRMHKARPLGTSVEAATDKDSVQIIQPDSNPYRTSGPIDVTGLEKETKLARSFSMETRDLILAHDQWHRGRRPAKDKSLNEKDHVGVVYIQPDKIMEYIQHNNLAKGIENQNQLLSQIEADLQRAGFKLEYVDEGRVDGQGKHLLSPVLYIENENGDQKFARIQTAVRAVNPKTHARIDLPDTARQLIEGLSPEARKALTGTGQRTVGGYEELKLEGLTRAQANELAKLGTELSKAGFSFSIRRSPQGAYLITAQEGLLEAIQQHLSDRSKQGALDHSQIPDNYAQALQAYERGDYKAQLGGNITPVPTPETEKIRTV